MHLNGLEYYRGHAPHGLPGIPPDGAGGNALTSQWQLYPTSGMSTFEYTYWGAENRRVVENFSDYPPLVATPCVTYQL